MPTPGGPRPTRVHARTVAAVAERVAAVTNQAGPGSGEALVTGVTLSSLTVRPGDLYAALPGQRSHGADYAVAACAAGAVAVLTDPEGLRRCPSIDRPVLVVPDPRADLGGLAAWLYGEPGRRLLTLGVTGTNGKTTTSYLLDAALRAAGHRPGLIGTIEIRAGDLPIPSTGTTPEAPDLHALLAVMVEQGLDACTMEISSHALAQHRTDGLVVDVAGFTNLTQDHLDYHHGMEEYFAAKAVLFTPQYARRAVICVDDPWGRRLAAQASVPTVTVSARPVLPGTPAAQWQVTRLESVGGLPVADLRTPSGSLIRLASALPGTFNLANTVLALAMLAEAGQDVQAAAAALGRAGPVPGRMEQVGAPDAEGAPLAVVDYAHTPDAVAAALAALRGSGHPLVVVLGAGGDRDRQKRPLMGRAAAAGADLVIVTDDNPRSEDPAQIRAAVLAGARAVTESVAGPVAGPVAGHVAETLERPDRRSAIAEAVRRAWSSRAGSGPGVVLVAGKGHEQGQEFAGTVFPFDDRAELAAALAAARVAARGAAVVPS